MLKQFFKTLLIGVISSGLTINPVFAQASADSRPVVTTDANGTKSATAKYSFQGVNDNDMIASIVMLATGYLAARLLVRYKPFDPKSNVPGDVMVAAAGGAAFIAGEVMSNMKFKGTMEEKTAEVVLKKGVTPNQEQLDYLQKLKESYEEAKKTTTTKKTLQTAAAAAFALAAATAGYLAWTEYAAFAECIGALNTASKVGVPAEIAKLSTATAGTGAAASKPYLACITELEAFEKLMLSINTKRQSPGKTSKEFAEIKLPMESADTFNKTTIPTTCAVSAAGKATIPLCETALKVQSFTQIATFLPPTAVSENSIETLNKILYPNGIPTFTSVPMQSKENELSLFEKGFNLLFPKAQASWLPLLGLTSGALVGYFMTSYAGIAEWVDYWMFVPFNRVIAWGTLGSLSMVAAKSSENTIKKLDENIAKIDKILNELSHLQKSIASQGVKGIGIQMQTVDPSKQQFSPYATDPTKKSQCMTNASTSNCSSLEDQIKNTPGFSQLPPSFQTLATQSGAMADGLSGSSGLSGKAMDPANSLAGKQNAINGLLKKTQNNLNALLKKNKKNPIDFNKEQDKFYKGMAAAVRKGLMQKGTTAAGFMASYGGAPLDSSAIGKPVELDQDKKAGSPVLAATPGAPQGEEKKEDMNFEFEQAPGELAANTAASGAADNAEYDVTTDEIHKDNGPSIFELISNRYLQSGYPKLLEEEPAKK